MKLKNKKGLVFTLGIPVIIALILLIVMLLILWFMGASVVGWLSEGMIMKWIKWGLVILVALLLWKPLILPLIYFVRRKLGV